MMKLHNTLTRKVEDFKPLKDNTVRFYSCGPTVYDHVHIGNLRAYIFADTLHRALDSAGYTVEQVMNFTDIDDKTVRRSHEKFPDDEPMKALNKLTEEYTKLFLEDMHLVGNRIDNIRFMAATDNIAEMQEMITALHKDGFAYIADDGVYFSIDAYQKSGKTYGQLLEITAASTAEARIQNDEYDKESVHDFALWKTQKPGEPAWDFTLDGKDLKGRPGWHIECSAMSRTALGQPFDLHTGGVDNMFPHHENEIAQSTADADNPMMAHFFTHNEHVLVDGKKMSKSAHNFYVLKDVIDKGYDPLAFRLKILQSHYRSKLNFTWEGLEAAQNLLQALRAWADLKHQKAAHQEKASKPYKAALQIMLEAIQDDLDTPRALTALASLSATEIVDAEKIQSLLNVIDRLFGLQLANRPDITHDQKDVIADRVQARELKDWKRADELRDQLAAQGLGLRDAGETIWYRLTQ